MADIEDYNTWNDLLTLGSDVSEVMDLNVLASIKREVRENMCEYFTNQDIAYYYVKNNRDIRATIYELLLIKAEDTTITISGMQTTDTSAYFRRLASRYRTYNTGVLNA